MGSGLDFRCESISANPSQIIELYAIFGKKITALYNYYMSAVIVI